MRHLINESDQLDLRDRDDVGTHMGTHYYLANGSELFALGSIGYLGNHSISSHAILMSGSMSALTHAIRPYMQSETGRASTWRRKV